MLSLMFPLNVSAAFAVNEDLFKSLLEDINVIFMYVNAKDDARTEVDLRVSAFEWVEEELDLASLLDDFEVGGEEFELEGVYIEDGFDREVESHRVFEYNNIAEDNIVRALALSLRKVIAEGLSRSSPDSDGPLSNHLCFDNDMQFCLRRRDPKRIEDLFSRINSFLKRCDYKVVIQTELYCDVKKENVWENDEYEEIDCSFFGNVEDGDIILIDVNDGETRPQKVTGCDHEDVGDVREVAYQEALLERVKTEVCMLGEIY